MYTDKVMEHFTNLRNVGEIEDANGVGEVGNASCGDIMKIFLKVEDGLIQEVKFKTFGCGAAIATSSMVTEMAIGKTIDEALELSNQAVADALDGLPAQKMHCSNLAADALHEIPDNTSTAAFQGSKPTRRFPWNLMRLHQSWATKSCSSESTPRSSSCATTARSRGMR